MDAVQLLTADHNRVRGLFKQARSAREADDISKLTALAQKIRTELEIHTRIEEEIFYPEVEAASSELAEMVAEGLEEHHVVDHLIEEMSTLDPSDDTWSAKLTVVMENVEHHAEEEEEEMFPEVRSTLGRSRLEELTQRLETRKAELGAPTTADKDSVATRRRR